MSVLLTSNSVNGTSGSFCYLFMEFILTVGNHIGSADISQFPKDSLINVRIDKI